MNQNAENPRRVWQEGSGRAALYRIAELATEFGADRIGADARAVAQRVAEGRFYVACVGQFKRGKSTLLNALVGHPILPYGIVPVTTVPTVIRYGECLAARVRFQSAAWTDIQASAIAQYVSEEKNPENAKGISGVEIFVPNPLLQDGMCLVDTPGLGSVFGGNTAATHAFIPQIDAAIVVLGTDPPISGDELQLVETVAHEVQDLIFVLNKADKASGIERTAAIEFARKLLEKRLKRTSLPILEISALDRLEQSGPERDWGRLVHALEDLMQHSGRSLVRRAADRAIRRMANQLLAAIKEERAALERPLEKSEQRIKRLRKTLEETSGAMRGFGVLIAAEQQRLSEVFAERRNVFLKHAQVIARKDLNERLPSLTHIHAGPSYRREVNHAAQEVARMQVTPWFEGEAKFAEEAFRGTARRFIELGNDFLHRFDEIGMPKLEWLPEELEQDPEVRSQSQFHFHLIERVAAPASPLLFIFDCVLGAIGWREGIIRDGQAFLDQLLEVNSSRVQSDVDERVRHSRQKLETEIKAVLREASSIAEHALADARTAWGVGASAVEVALKRLQAVDREVRGFLQKQ